MRSSPSTSPPRDRPGHAARKAARDLMTSVTEERRLLADLLPGAVAALEPADRARAQRLATEGLRWAQRSDRVLGRYLRNRPPDAVLNLLRLAVWELLGDGAAPHGVVDAAVGIARADPDTNRMSGMVNAVLRNVLRAEPDWDGMPVPELPKWLRKPLRADYGKTVVAAMEAAHAAGAPLDLTPKDGDAEGLAAAVGGEALPTGSVRLTERGQVTSLPGFVGGNWWVQDAAAALPAKLLDVRPGERVLDLCAAPGGKTLQLAAAGADVTAVDVSEARMARVAENLERVGLTATLVIADALEWDDAEGFDAVLLDAPCSATGTIRRHPDLPFAKAGSDLSPLLELQALLFDRAVALTRPGGRLVYCTCSLLKAEGEDQFAAAIERHPGLAPDEEALRREWIEREWRSDPAMLRLRPDFWRDRGGMDGFYIAALRKAAGGRALRDRVVPSA